MKRALALLIPSFAMLACGASDHGSTAVCTPFDTQACLGEGACRGGQSCLASGTGWSVCDCGSPSPSPAEAPAALICASDQKSSSQVCDDNALIREAGSTYWINDNVWGRPTGDTTSLQCAWLSCESGGTIAWGTRWAWQGAGNTVKAYPSAIFGWHWGLKATNTGLPVALDGNHRLPTGWRFTVRPSGDEPFRMNVSYDLWLHTIPTPDASDTGANVPSDEVMVWLYAAGAASPLGAPVATAVSLAGATWDLWEGQANSWYTYSFVRTEATTQTQLDLAPLLGYLVTSRGLDNHKYLTSIQAGTEIFVGTGQLDTEAYYVRVE